MNKKRIVAYIIPKTIFKCKNFSFKTELFNNNELTPCSRGVSYDYVSIQFHISYFSYSDLSTSDQRVVTRSRKYTSVKWKSRQTSRYQFVKQKT